MNLGSFCVFIVFNRRKMEVAQKTAEEEERYKKEMEKYSIIYLACIIHLL